MLLKTLKLKNIRSYTDETIEFPQGSVLLAGDIGCGKSTALLSIDFALFGLSRTELAGSDLLRHGKSFGSVELDFELEGKNYRIKRTLKRSGESVVQDSGQLVVDNRPYNLTAVELKARILDILGYPMEFLKKNKPVFRYTVYTPQEQMKHILLSPDRLEILRKIFSIDKYGQIKSSLKILISELRSMRRELEAFSRDLEEKIKSMEDMRYLLNDLRREACMGKDSLDAVDARMKRKSQEIDAVRRRLEEAGRYRNEKEKKELEISVKTRRIERIRQELEDIEKDTEAAEAEISRIEHIGKPEKGEQETASAIMIHEREKNRLIQEKAVAESEAGKLSKILEQGMCAVCGQKVQDKSRFSDSIGEKRRAVSALAALAEGIEREIAGLRKQERLAVEHRLSMLSKAKEEKTLAQLRLKKISMEKENADTEAEIYAASKAVAYAESQLVQYQNIDSVWKELEREMESIREEKSAAEKKISRTEQQISDTEAQAALLEKETAEKAKGRQKISSIDGLVSWLEGYFLHLIDTIEKHVMYAIQSQFNSYFQAWFGMLMDGEQLSVRVSESFEPAVEQNGYETEYQNLSGGEKTAVALAYRLALNRVMNDIIGTMKTKDLLILDEPTDGFSSDQLDRIRYVLEELKLRQVIIVSHEPKIDTFVDSVIRISKEGHVSKVVRYSK